MSRREHCDQRPRRVWLLRNDSMRSRLANAITVGIPPIDGFGDAIDRLRGRDFRGCDRFLVRDDVRIFGANRIVGGRRFSFVVNFSRGLNLSLGDRIVGRLGRTGFGIRERFGCIG